MDQITEFFNSTIGTSLLNLGVALLILLIGYIVARIIAIDAVVVLEPCDALSKPRLGNPDCVGCAAEVAVLGQRASALELPEVEHSLSSND